MQTSAGEVVLRYVASAFIAVVLLAQASTLIFTAVRSDALWVRAYPIVAYDMYRDPHHEGEAVKASWLLEAVFADGSVQEIPREMFKLSVWDWIGLMDGVADNLDKRKSQLLGLVRDRVPNNNLIRELHVKNLGLSVAKDGPRKGPSEVVMKLPFGPTAALVADPTP